jgi:hypothetical protein
MKEKMQTKITKIFVVVVNWKLLLAGHYTGPVGGCRLQLRELAGA